MVMRLSMDLELPDIPGQLMLALESFKKYNGNIISVVHHRDRKTPRGTILVQIVFEIKRSKIESVTKSLQDNGIIVVRAGEDRFVETVSVLLVGHVVHTGLDDTINQVDATGFAEVEDLCLKMPGIDEPSSAYIKIRATGKDEIETALSILRKASAQKKLLMIEPVEAE
ncbi:MAG: amino acid-binding protein [Methanotrichaceae archaeon]